MVLKMISLLILAGVKVKVKFTTKVKSNISMNFFSTSFKAIKKSPVVFECITTHAIFHKFHKAEKQPFFLVFFYVVRINLCSLVLDLTYF